jgi:hypothetical protein
MSHLPCPKTRSGLPVAIASPAALREYTTATMRRQPREAFDVTLRTSALTMPVAGGRDVWPTSEAPMPLCISEWQTHKQDTWKVPSGAHGAPGFFITHALWFHRRASCHPPERPNRTTLPNVESSFNGTEL